LEPLRVAFRFDLVVERVFKVFKLIASWQYIFLDLEKKEKKLATDLLLTDLHFWQ
jgi:hypothetical protein